MTEKPGRGFGRALARSVPGVLALILLGGCFDEPKIEERWTRIDLQSSNLVPLQALPLGARESIDVQAAVTYRAIVTGFAVADLRASSTLTTASVEVDPTADRLRMAQDIDRVLANSVSVGRATRAVTGWDHLIQEIHFSFSGAVPAVVDTSGGPVGLFLVCYLGSGQRIERGDGTDPLIVTPFVSSQRQLLPVGMELAVGP